MKKLVLVGFLLVNLIVFAQKDCELSTNVVDSLGFYKATKSCIVYEKNFNGKNIYVFISLINDNGKPYLNLQTIQKSKSFISANCMDENSKLYLQLMNGKIITLLHTKDEDCGTMLRIAEENKYSRVNSSNFMFLKGSIEELKTSKVARGSQHGLYVNRTYFGLYSILNELRAKVVTTRPEWLCAVAV